MAKVTFKNVCDKLQEVSEEPLLADGYEGALIGYVELFGRPPLALYDRGKCIEILVKRDGMSYEDAEEFFEFNTIGAWVGEHTPAYATVLRKPDLHDSLQNGAKRLRRTPKGSSKRPSRNHKVRKGKRKGR